MACRLDRERQRADRNTRTEGATGEDHRRPAHPLFLLALIVFAAVGLAACGVDPHQARLCERVLVAVEADAGRLLVLRRETVADDPNAVAIIYARPPVTEVEHRLVCRYGGGGFADDRLMLTGVELEREGNALSAVRLHMLRVWLSFGADMAPKLIDVTSSRTSESIVKECFDLRFWCIIYQKKHIIN